MEKMKLELDELEVSTFEVAAEAIRQQDGTVQANTTVDACFPTLVRPKTCDC
jgi:hypothetical protein